MSDENAAEPRDTDAEFRRLKADFLRIAHNRRRRGLSQSDSSRSPLPVRRQLPRRSANLPKFKIATFYSTDVRLWFNQIETQFDLHQITDDDERYRLYENLKAILIERRGLTTSERVNKVISGEKLGSDILSRFLRRLSKTGGFGTKAIVGKAVIHQAFIRQMPPSVRAHLVTQPDSASLENLAMLADRAVAAEKDVDEAKPGVAEINVSESGKLVGLLKDRLKKLETATAKATKKKTYGHSQPTENRAAKTQFVPIVQAKTFMPNNQAVTRQDVSNNNKKDSRPNAPSPQTTQSNVAQPIYTADAPVCFYHQTFGDRARTCREPCAFSLN